MLRPLHFVLFFVAVAFVASTPVPGDVGVGRVSEPSHVELQPDTADLEADATGWGYAQPWYHKGWYGRGGGGWYGKGWSGGGGGWYGKGYGWGGGRGYGWW